MIVSNFFYSDTQPTFNDLSLFLSLDYTVLEDKPFIQSIFVYSIMKNTEYYV